jgi:hypothetical protein
MNSMENDLRRKAHFYMAQKRMEQIRDFYMHLVIYCTVNILFFIFWLLDSGMPKTFWRPAFIMMAGAAGLVVLAHALLVFGAIYILPKDWEEKELRKLMDKEKQITKYE